MDSYEELKAITDKYYTDWQMPSVNVFTDLLARHGVRLRQKDGVLHEVTFSVPKSVQNGLVLGLRYRKRDGSFSEDPFLFQEGRGIKTGYRGSLEGMLPEYSGTHKRVPSP